MNKAISALGAGVLFGVGLSVAGMTLPSKVIGFFDFFGSWDPSLAFVMLGAILVYAPLYLIAKKKKMSLLGVELRLPTRRDIDARLVLGSVIFGVGWGLAGYCPGPGIVAMGTLDPGAIVFSVSMIAGFGIFKVISPNLPF